MKLTAEQLAVVQHGQGHARVAAVAGAGKTTTLVSRVLHLLSRGVSARRILVLMFNRAAREDFTAKLLAMAPAGQSLPEVRTFHSIGHRLTQSLTRWGWLSPRELLTADWQRERLLKQAVILCTEEAGDAAREAALESERIEALGNFCDLVKAEMAAPHELYERLDFGPDTQHFVDAFDQLEGLLEQHSRMTYADLLYRPLKCLESSHEARARVQGFLDYVIIDEYQDINEAQQRLLAMLAGEGAEVMVVGDANQCIYEWRGARPDYMLERFAAAFGEATDYPLSTTFRHGHALALTANYAIQGNRRRPDQLCLAAPSNPRTSIDVGQGGSRLVEELNEWSRSGRDLSDACVLVRSWTLSVSVQLQLLRAGIPFRLAREERYVFRLPLVQALAGYLRLSRDANLLRHPAHLLLLLSQPTPFVARERLQALASRLADSQNWPDRHDPVLMPLKPQQRRTLKRRWELLCELPRLANMPPARLLELIVERLDAEKVLKRAAARREKGEEDVRLLDVLIEQADDLAQAPEDFVDMLYRPVESRDDGVLVTTVHGAKGLEWPFVMLWGVNEEDFPHYSKDNPLNEERLEEERRLFYVAVTRARERLLMLHDGGDHRPSRFLSESAWQDGNRIAEALEATDGGAVIVQDTALVGRYLDALGLSLPLERSALPTHTKIEASESGLTARYMAGQHINHEVFGKGEILIVEGDPDNPVIDVRFVHAGRRRLIARRSPLELL